MASYNARILQWDNGSGVGWAQHVEGHRMFYLGRQQMPAGYQATAVGYSDKANSLHGQLLRIGRVEYISESDKRLRALRVAPVTPLQLTRFTARETGRKPVLKTPDEVVRSKDFLVLNRLNGQTLACRKNPEGVLAALTEVFAHKSESGSVINPGFWTDGPVLYAFVRLVTEDAKEWIRGKLGKMAWYACVRKIVIVNAITTQIVMVADVNGVPVLVTKRALLDCNRQLRAQDAQWTARRPDELGWARMKSDLIQRMPDFPDEAVNIVWQMRRQHMLTGQTDLDLYQRLLAVLRSYGPRVYAFHPFETGEVTLSGIDQASVAAVA